MPERQFITPIAGGQVTDLFEANENIVIRGEVECSAELSCPKCSGRQLRIKATVHGKIKHGVWGGKHELA